MLNKPLYDQMQTLGLRGMARAFERQAAGEVDFRRLRRAVGGRARRGGKRI